MQVAGFLIAMVVCRSVPAVPLNFDDGTAGSAIGAFYASKGVGFSNAQWVALSPEYVNTQATAPLEIMSISSGAFMSVGDPLVITFAAPQSHVSILGANVGFAGARIDAYDSVVGGVLVDFAQAIGSTLTGEFPIGGGFFTQEEFLLSVDAPSILRLELYRPNSAVRDGIVFDNLSFSSVPLPASVWILGLGLVALITIRRFGSPARPHGTN